MILPSPVLGLGILVGHVGLVEFFSNFLGDGRVIVVLVDVIVQVGLVVVEVGVDISCAVTPPLALVVVLALPFSTILPRLPQGTILNDGRPLEQPKVIDVPNRGKEVQLGGLLELHPIHKDPCRRDVGQGAPTQRFQKPLNPFKEGYDKDN